MEKILRLIALLVLVLFLAGCGETIRGAVEDTTRIGEGVHKVFISEKS
ncbi:MAG: hypothetical protein ACE5JK_01160 [Candidatus Omnitrophota bacterium]